MPEQECSQPWRKTPTPSSFPEKSRKPGELCPQPPILSNAPHTSISLPIFLLGCTLNIIFFFFLNKPSFTGPLITSPRQLSPGRGYRGGAGGVRPFGPGSALPSAALEMSLLTSAGREGSAGEKKTSAAPPASLGAKNTTPRHTVWWGVGHGSQRDQGQEGFAWCSRSAGAGGKARALGETERKQEKRQEELLAGGGRKGERQSLEIPTNRGTSPFPPAIATSPAAQSACSVLPAHTRGSQRCFLKTKHGLDSF